MSLELSIYLFILMLQYIQKINKEKAAKDQDFMKWLDRYCNMYSWDQKSLGKHIFNRSVDLYCNP